MNPNEGDPVIDEIREVRYRVSERFGHDHEGLVAHYIELQERFRDRLIRTREAPGQTGQSAA